MKIPTKTLLSLLVASATVSRQPTLGAPRLIQKRDEQLVRLLQRHDRKGELRAALLNINQSDLSGLLKKNTMVELARQHGFYDMKSFRYALHAKIKDELRARGWSTNRIQSKILKKFGGNKTELPK